MKLMQKNWPHTLTMMGFDKGRFVFALRTAVACLLAILVATWMGLDHPHWAGMSVWAAAQPLRGQLIEKSIFRLLGSISGILVGISLVVVYQAHPLWMVLGLALWIGACTWIGNLQRGLVAYGTVLAGYSASMVALLDIGHPQNILALGADRLATVLTGIVIVTATSYVFANKAASAPLNARARNILADVLEWLATSERPNHARNLLLSSLATLDEEMDQHAAGSIKARRQIKGMRRTLLALVPILTTRSLTKDANPEKLIQAANLVRQDQMASAAELLATELPPAQIQAFQEWAETPRLTLLRNPMQHVRGIHRDLIGARQAGLRSGGAVLVFGMLWQFSGWEQGAFLLLGLSVMISVFAGFENPSQIMRHVLTGQLLAVAASLACRWLLWPHADSQYEMIMMMAPFILIGPFLAAHRSTMIAAFDFSMLFLLITQPIYPMSTNMTEALMIAAAVLIAPILAWLGYRLVYPANLQKRQAHIETLLRADLRKLAQSQTALSHTSLWQGRIAHRGLRLLRHAERNNNIQNPYAAPLGYWKLASAIYHCHRKLADPNLDKAEQRRLKLLLARSAQQNHKLQISLARMGRHATGDEARLMGQAAYAAHSFI